MKAAKGAPPGKSSKTKINLLRPEDVWHPKRGAPWGNRNAQTHGANSRELRDLKARVRATIRSANALFAALRVARLRRLADSRPPP